MSSEDVLKLLEAHGQQFLQSFDTPVVIGKRKDCVQPKSERKQKKLRKAQEEEVAEDEWTGIGQSSSDEDEDTSETDDSLSSEESDDGEGEEIEDDDFRYDTQAQGSQKPQPKQPDVVVFSEAGTLTVIPKKLKSGFMSSKVSKLTADAVQSTKKKGRTSDDEDDDLTNAQNDALLHRLVHTQLLSGSLNPDLNLKPAQRKKALEGRVLEAAGKAKLGKGEAIVRQAERNRAAKRVRDGLMEKQKERHEKKVEEAKQLGNYHPTLKALYDAEAAGLAKPKNRKREKGLKMGVGSFKDGILRLNKRDVSAVVGRGGTSRGRSRGRGRGRGGKR